MSAAEAAAAVADAHRREWAFVLAATVRVTKNLDVAEECVQDAYAKALTAWEAGGVPAAPGAWLTTVARRRALDLLRRDAALRRFLPLLLDDAAEASRSRSRSAQTRYRGTGGPMKTMMAVRAHTRGGPETLVYEEAPLPEPGPGEALVAVHAAAITFAELTWDESWTTRDGADRTPVVPSHEMSGTVAALGGDATGLRVGDEVYGLIDFDRDGAAAEYCALPAADLAGRPRTVSHVEAAALPLSALTAWQALVDHAALTPGETVLVHGGAGGVGVFAVQLAALLGGRVATTARGEDADFLRRLGAERVIDRAAEDFDQVVSGVDVVIDTVGGATLRRSYDVVRPGGRVVTLGAPPPPDLAGRHGVESLFFIVRPDRAQLTRLAELVDGGDLRSVVGETFPLAEARRAFESGAQGHRRGKTVLVVR